MLEFHGTSDPIIHYDSGVSHGESYLSVPDFMKRWADKDGCSAIPLRTQPVSGVELQTWQSNPGTAVQHTGSTAAGTPGPAHRRGAGPAGRHQHYLRRKLFDVLPAAPIVGARIGDRLVLSVFD